VFQAFHLIPTLSAVENVAFPLYPTAIPPHERRQRALACLEQVGLAHRASHRPGQLSGGEQQRVAVARALSNRPRLILADEPTGNLDSQSSAEIMDLFRTLHRAEGVAIIVVTHDAEVAGVADRLIEMKDGRLVNRNDPVCSVSAHI
jgi:putative ABC transport system ATP-binding protein